MGEGAPLCCLSSAPHGGVGQCRHAAFCRPHMYVGKEYFGCLHG